MKTPRIVLLLLIAVGSARAQAQDNSTAATTTAPAQREMEKWIAATDAQWQAVFKRDVADVREAELNKLKLQFLTSLEEAFKKASIAGDLKGALALRDEQKRFGDTNVFPEKDEEGDAAAVKAIRAASRAQLAQLEKNHAARAKALHAKYDQVLAQAQTQLTQRQRLDDAVLVQTKRTEVAAAWLGPAVAVAAEKPNPPVTASTTPVTPVQNPATAPKVPFGTKPAPSMAKVEAQDAPLVLFKVGETRFKNGVQAKWTEIPDMFEGYQFSQPEKAVPTLSFKVISDGLVYFACTSRFGGGGSGGPWKSELVSEAQLQQKGWHRVRGVEIKEIQPDHVWWVYARTCRACESFSYRTEKYHSPFLLVK